MTRRTLESLARDPAALRPRRARRAARARHAAVRRRAAAATMPDLELELADVERRPRPARRLRRVCGFTLRDALPADLPARARVPAAHGAADRRRLPVPRRRPRPHREPDRRSTARSARRGARRSACARRELEPHPKGRTFALRHRGARRRRARLGGRRARTCAAAAATSPPPSDSRRLRPATLRRPAEWRCRGDLGRRYAAVSGDRNPIHMHGLTAKAFGFPRAIAHGMWTKARCLAALEPGCPDAFTVEVALQAADPAAVEGHVRLGRRRRGVRRALGPRRRRRTWPARSGSEAAAQQQVAARDLDAVQGVVA